VLRNCHDQKLTKDEAEEIQKQSALEEVEEPEGKTTELSKLTERLGIDGAPKKMCLTILIRKAGGSNNEIRNYGDSCPLCRDSEEASQVFVSPDISSSFLHVFFGDSCIAKCTDGQCR
jgi:hypothetical protein